MNTDQEGDTEGDNSGILEKEMATTGPSLRSEAEKESNSSDDWQMHGAKTNL